MCEGVPNLLDPCAGERGICEGHQNSGSCGIPHGDTIVVQVFEYWI